MTLKSILKSIAVASTTTSISISTGNAKRRRIGGSATASAINLGVGEVPAVKRCVHFDLPHQALPKAQGEWILLVSLIVMGSWIWAYYQMCTLCVDALSIPLTRGLLAQL